MAFLSGLSAFPITPSDRGGHVDTAALKRLVTRLCTAGVDSIGLLGSTGTYMYLSREERRRALSVAIDETGASIPVVVGVGALRTDEAVRLAQDAKASGAAAGLLAAVSYAPLTEDEVFEHFSTVARESGLPIVIYDNPGTTHFRFTANLVERLAHVPGIVAIKNPTEKPEEISSHLAQQRSMTPKGFPIGYSGDWSAAEAMICGADTWYSVLAGILPDVCLRMVRAAQNGDVEEARRLDATLSPIWDLFKQFSSLRTVYTIADLLGVSKAEPPRPILPLPALAKEKVAHCLTLLEQDLA
ncbi:dihydrodipicolinate synthase family protein [Sinorhizobium saheli]|uniref:Dihydrodipicolinate synthase n=1 Tax=Sinorhizobium saheli TaxID=36856 RepID=A0A178YT95_SINSA|nr:dihydrodipicolinate synthase family protein [Sinorhizobium saheli]MQW86426.1 dihydrodipicolinate synthase family protein [Sinorhizobium saheli]OAP50501.1 dihydrodipicolinate synthase [Sinorhizobium saheli]